MQDPVFITWLGHSCFRLEYKGWSLITDPYADGSVPGLPPLRTTAGAVFCSHDHGDHNAVRCVKCTREAPPPDFSQTEYVCPHDDVGGGKRGMNIARIFRFGALRVAHLGDIGAAPERALGDALRGVDALLLPVGGFYTIDAAHARALADDAGARVVIPMHYRGADFGFDVLTPVEDFTALGGPVCPCPDSTLKLTGETPRQVALLRRYAAGE